MPSESLLLAITSGLGVGVFAGIVSGVCYIVVTGLTAKRPRNSSGSQWFCSICGVHFRSIEGVLESGRVVRCIKCGASICRARCSKLTKKLEHQQAGWVCQTCQHPESWFKGILKSLRPNLQEGRTSKTEMESGKIEEIDEDLDVLKKEEKLRVRDFIERLIEAMLGKNIDSARVTRVYNDEKYLPILGESPCSAHASLKLLIQKIIQEVIGLPALEKNETEIEMKNGEVENRTYEDLLATAILNKVVENYQNELGTSKANSVSSRMSTSSVNHNDKEYYFGTETLCAKWRHETSTPADIDAASVSSLDDWIRSDSSVGSTKYVDPVSLSIQQRDESSSTDDEAKVKPVLQEPLLIPEDDEWQENWMMQKRAFGRNTSPVPVPMLVPNPSTEAKVLIGDREADDTTDLSDAGSDIEEVESTRSIEHILTSSKTVIGGKNPLCDGKIKEKLDFELNESQQHHEQKLSVTAPGTEDNSFLSFESQTEQDTEYTEKYATLPRTILLTPPPTSGNLVENQIEILPVEETSKKSPDETDGNEVAPKVNGYHKTEIPSDEDDDTIDVFNGTYSKREKEKWNNAIEMKNNPYSSENLKRRLSNQSASSVSSLFGNDYYTRETSKSSDSGIKLDSTENSPPGDKILCTEDAEEWNSPLPMNCTYTAVPAFIETDDLRQTDTSSYGITSPTSCSLIDASSDSDLSIERVYNLPSGKVYVHEKSDSRSPFENSTPVPFVKTELESIEKCMDFSLEFSEDDSLQHNTNMSADPEITDLCDKHLVKDIVGRFSKSYPNLASQKDIETGSDYKSETPTNTKYVAPKLVYSLTARSIPKQFRDELKTKEETPKRRSSSSTTLHEMQSEDTLPFPIAKSKIKFFESISNTKS